MVNEYDDIVLARKTRNKKGGKNDTPAPVSETVSEPETKPDSETKADSSPGKGDKVSNDLELFQGRGRGKCSTDGYQRTTLYLTTELLNRLRMAKVTISAQMGSDVDMSDIAEVAINAWLDERDS